MQLYDQYVLQLQEKKNQFFQIPCFLHSVNLEEYIHINNASWGKNQSINSYMLIRKIRVLTFIYLLQKTVLGLVNTEYLQLHSWCLRTKADHAVCRKLDVWKPNYEYSLKKKPQL